MSVDGPSWAIDMLRTARVGRLATANRTGQPLVVPVCFALVDEYARQVWLHESGGFQFPLRHVFETGRREERCVRLGVQIDREWFERLSAINGLERCEVAFLAELRADPRFADYRDTDIVVRVTAAAQAWHLN